MTCLLRRAVLSALILGALALVSSAAPDTIANLPVLQVRLSPAFLNAALAEPIDRSEMALSCADGFLVTTQAQVGGWAWLELAPSDRDAALCLRIQGEGCAQSCSVRRSLHVQTRERIAFHADIPLTMTTSSLMAGPVSVASATHSELSGICTTLGPAADLATRGTVRVGFPLLHRHIDQLATEATAQTVRDRVGRELAQRLPAIERSNRTEVIDPLLRAGVRSEELGFSSGPAELLLTARLAGASEGAGRLPGGREDVTVRLNQLFVEGLAQRSLRGRTLTGDELDENASTFARSFRTTLPPRLQDGKWSMTFADPRPLTLRLQAGRLAVTLHGQEYESRATIYPGMDVTARYSPSVQGEGIRLERTGPLEVFPPGFDPRSGMRLTVREIALRAFLLRRFDRLLPRELTLQMPELPEAFRRAGRLAARGVSADQGWLVVEAVPVR
jgi:hypothetical protein